MSAYDEMLEIAGIHEKLKDPKVATVCLDYNKVLNDKTVEGLNVDYKETEDGIDVNIHVEKDAMIEKPVQMCFAVMHRSAEQRINLKVKMEDNSRISIIGHCIFPSGKKIKHIMHGKIDIGKNCRYDYYEKHIHNEEGTVEAYPQAEVNVGENSRFNTIFDLLKGRVGKLLIDYSTKGAKNSSINLDSRVSGSGDDDIEIRETAELNGEKANGVLRSRVAVKDNAEAHVFNRLIARSAYSRGHVDCTEIMTGNGKVKAYPEVEVLHPKARATHEANLGGVDNKQLETLMAKGLSEKEAEEMIIEGLLS
ncbi:MAG: SufB/SufD family protein [Nanobdellota archaeon]